MRTNETGKDLIKSFEGLKLTAYKCPAGVWTIGWGTTLGVTKGMTITLAQAEDLFSRDLVKFEKAVEKNVTVPLNENQFAALVSFAYNLGEGNLKSSTLLKKVNAGDFKAAAAEFPKWNKAGGKVLAGLTRRRADEAKLFNTPVNNKPVEEPVQTPAPASSGPGFFAQLIHRIRGKA
ncbi:lysozyme [Methylobacterium terricola]|uniref:Lysozyme n=1 Tax=Methylobacterium terricola TaxID=2583531 RepID=A0A5C4LC77_9HYPH|nr:lysozyme [Methylobacterium terricola]TNC10833.1 lysozyme [Methylobacterium terricola]